MSRKHPIDKICIKCNKVYQTVDPRQQFCSKSCVRKGDPLPDLVKKKLSLYNIKKFQNLEEREKQSIKLKERWKNNPELWPSSEENSKRARVYTKGKFNPNVKSLYELSSRTVSKILKRLNIGCSRCGWKESSCDLHHINGRKIPDPHNHTNITCLCPNCHRLAHTNKIDKSSLMNLVDQIGDRWKDVYFG